MSDDSLYDDPPRRPLLPLFAALGVVAALVAMCGGASLIWNLGAAGQPVAPASAGALTGTASPIKLTSVEVMDRYSKDEFAADRELTGRPLEITGRVSAVDAAAGTLVIETPAPPEPQAPPSGPVDPAKMWDRLAAASVRGASAPVTGVRCALRTNRGKTAGVGQTVTIRGDCRGRNKARELVLDQCAWVAP